MLSLYKKITFEDFRNRPISDLTVEEKIECNSILSEFITKFKDVHLS